MVSLLLAAALSQPLWFDVQHQGNIYAITPMAHLSVTCECQVQITFQKIGQAGTSKSHQQGRLAITGDEDIALSRMKFTLDSHEKALITLTLTDGKQLAFEKRLVLPPQ